MTNEEKAQKLAEEHENATSFGIESPYHAALGAAIDMAEWKDEQFENKLRELLYKNFYIHPHDEGLICSEAFDCKDDFDIFVEDFIKELNSI